MQNADDDMESLLSEKRPYSKARGLLFSFTKCQECIFAVTKLFVKSIDEDESRLGRHQQISNPSMNLPEKK